MATTEEYPTLFMPPKPAVEPMFDMGTIFSSDRIRNLIELGNYPLECLREHSLRRIEPDIVRVISTFSDIIIVTYIDEGYTHLLTRREFEAMENRI